MYCYDSIEELELKIDLKSYIEKNKIKCKKCGGELSVVLDDKFYMCPKCTKDGSKGNIFTAVMEQKNIKFISALEYIAEKENFQIKNCVMDCDISNHDYEKHCKKCELHKEYKKIEN